MVTKPLKYIINAKGKVLDFSSPKVMGILNVTPDSFFDGGKLTKLSEFVSHAEALWKAGADLIDIGAYSSRPGAHPVDVEEELNRIVPVVEAIHKRIPNVILSVDTFRARVARESVHHGASMVNDISGGSLDESMFRTIGELDVPYVLMHMRGNPATMQKQTHYEDLILEMMIYFQKKIARLRQEGVNDIILDPGLGFSKTLTHNYQIIKRLKEFMLFDLPIVGAASRKSMIYNALDCTPAEALNGTTVINTLLLLQGAQLLRVHDVREAKETIKLIELYSEV